MSPSQHAAQPLYRSSTTSHSPSSPASPVSTLSQSSPATQPSARTSSNHTKNAPNSEDLAERKPVKIRWNWGTIIFTQLIPYFACLLLVMSMFIQFRAFTPTLWDVELLGYLSALSQGYEVSNKTLQIALIRDNPRRCKTLEEKRVLVSGPATNVSGWYGPGVFIAWLISANAAAISSIWHSKSSPSNKDSEYIDAELLFVLFYPTVALFDVISRLIQCRIDPGINAGVFVLVYSLVVVGPASGLSWQANTVDDEAVYDKFEWDGYANPAKSLRELAWNLLQLLTHCVVVSINTEPYKARHLYVVYSILSVVMLYSLLHQEVLLDKRPYQKPLYRPRIERVLVFCIVQLVFGIVVLSTNHSIWPATATKFWDLDQFASVLSAIIGLFYLRGKSIMEFFKAVERYRQGFCRIRNGEESTVELQEVVVIS